MTPFASRGDLLESRAGRYYNDQTLTAWPSRHREFISMQDVDPSHIYRAVEKKKPVLIVLSGPSGVGKDTTLWEMQRRIPNIHFVVTATTRPMRPGEVDGVDYHFVSMGEFASMIERGELLEYAIVYGDYKGTPRRQVQAALDSGKDVMLRIDVQGAATIRKLFPEAIMIFLTAPSEDELVHRLCERKTDPPGKLQLRIAEARQEMKRIDEFQYVVINRDNMLDETVEQVRSIIVAEKCRYSWRPVRV